MSPATAVPTALAVLTALALLVTSSTAAAADPSVWSRAADPSSAETSDAIERADRLLSEYEHLRRQPGSFRRAMVLNKARRALERAGAVTSSDPRVRLRLAQISYGLFEVEREQDRLEQARDHFAFVAKSDAPVLVLAEAWSALAICNAHAGRHDDEVDAYGHALALEQNAPSRARLFANRAEGLMATGKILQAVRGYRQSLRETPNYAMLDIGPTTLWGLAVALDRSGDLHGALERIGLARSYDPTDARINGPNWFYVPDYDENWYQALGHWQLARAAEDRDLRLASYYRAIASWRAYLERAPDSDRWLTLASIRLKQCEKELARVQATKPAPRAGRMPRSPSLDAP